jgi:hypothetical protein
VAHTEAKRPGQTEIAAVQERAVLRGPAVAVAGEEHMHQEVDDAKNNQRVEHGKCFLSLSKSDA